MLWVQTKPRLSSSCNKAGSWDRLLLACENAALRARLVRFYTKYNADKLGDVDATVDKYKDGKEEKNRDSRKKHI